MADGTWRSVDARCPFYVRDGRRTITCEGLTDGEEIKRRLSDQDHCTEVFRRYCSSRYWECAVYKLINLVKYGIKE